MFGRKKIEPTDNTALGTPIEIAAVAPFDFDNLPIKELFALKARLDGLVTARRAEVQTQFTEQLELYGLTIEEVTPKKKKRNFPVKYRDPENDANTWSGMGKPKKWLQNYLDQGRALEDFAVPGADA